MSIYTPRFGFNTIKDRGSLITFYDFHHINLMESVFPINYSDISTDLYSQEDENRARLHI